MKVVIIAMLFFSVVIKAQVEVIPLWNKNMSNKKDLANNDIPEFKSETEDIKTSNDPNISVFLPGKNLTGQAVLVIPGGAYQFISNVYEGEDIAKWLNSNGIAAIVLKYRLPNKNNDIVIHKSPMLDASRAMKIIRANAEKWQIDKNNIGVIGFSAGGHLAATLGTQYDKEEKENDVEFNSISARPDFMVLMYPVISMDSSFTHMGSRENLIGENPSQELIDYYSMEKQVTENTPSTLMFHTADDKIVPVHNSIVFYKALQEKKIKSEMHLFQEGRHGFALANGENHLELWKQLCIDWLRSFDAE